MIETDTKRIALVVGMFSVVSDSGDGEMKEMNNRASAGDECRCENGGDGEKERDFREKITPRFVAEIFATDVEERRL